MKDWSSCVDLDYDGLPEQGLCIHRIDQVVGVTLVGDATIVINLADGHRIATNTYDLHGFIENVLGRSSADLLEAALNPAVPTGAAP